MAKPHRNKGLIIKYANLSYFEKINGNISYIWDFEIRPTILIFSKNFLTDSSSRSRKLEAGVSKDYPRFLTETGENVQKLTRVFSTRR